ncbi:hypothetical protein FOZ63_003232 [Perkinsus olseni]|uniref:Uncharacterized protein n=1 Tax=Perkinsus olseni TaxID=32597 RepID=A0A7J6QQV7_PEROL|nr:hypothetical protein FOZ60_001842 [Perkinsus olseni]KAF4709920.1 hypothetical protein FOZ63_003232 [Perkinsus olseni]
MGELNPLVTRVISPLPPLPDERIQHPFGLLNDRPQPCSVMASRRHEALMRAESLRSYQPRRPYIGSAAAPCDISPPSTHAASHHDEDEDPEQDLVADLSPNGPPSTRRRTPRARSSVIDCRFELYSNGNGQVAQSLDFTAAVMSVPTGGRDDGDEWMATDTNPEDPGDSNSSHSEIGLGIDIQDISRVLESGSNVDESSNEDDGAYQFTMDT